MIGHRFSLRRKWVVPLLSLYAIMQIYCIQQLSINYDEGLFAAYGSSVLKFQREKDVILYDSKLPVTALNMLPRVVEQTLNPGLSKSWPQAQGDIENGRYVSLLVAILLGLLIFHWASKIYSTQTAFVVLLFYLLCPNFLAHGIFVSSDIFACFFMTATFYYLWLFFKEPKPLNFLIMCVATGLAQISKFSMVHLFILVPLLFIVGMVTRKKENPQPRFSAGKIFLYTALFIFINWLIVCASHLFYEVFLPISDYHFKSLAFNKLQQFFLKIAPGFPIPLPSSYIGSMDAVVYFDGLGGGVKGSLNGAPYILGKNSTNGFWYYYFVAMGFKVPIATLLLWFSSIIVFAKSFTRRSFFTTDIYLLVPIFYFLIYLNFFYSTQVGIRHILIIFPLLFIFSGKIIEYFLSVRKHFIIYSLLCYQAVSVLLYFPHFLPYTNEFILNKKLAYKKIADTNICYGEGGKFLQDYLTKNPDAVYMPEKPVAGKIVLEVNEMLNLNISTIHKYDWGKFLTPIDHIHSQYLIFDVSKERADSLNQIHHSE